MFYQHEKPSTKSSQPIIDERIQCMSDKIQSLRQSDFFMKKSSIFNIQLQNNRENHIKSSSRFTGLRKSQIIERPSKIIEIEQFLSKYNKKAQKTNSRNSLLGLKQPKMIKSQFISVSQEEDQVIKYQKPIKAQKSDSEMKYLQICNMSQQYIQQFLDILEDHVDRNPEHKKTTPKYDKSNTRKTAASQQQSQKYLQMVREQQIENYAFGKRKSWRQRCQQAITKSRNIMDKAKLSPKFLRFQENL